MYRQLSSCIPYVAHQHHWFYMSCSMKQLPQREVFLSPTNPQYRKSQEGDVRRPRIPHKLWNSFAATIVAAAVIAAAIVGSTGGILLTHLALLFREHKICIEQYAHGRRHKAHIAEGTRHL